MKTHLCTALSFHSSTNLAFGKKILNGKTLIRKQWGLGEAAVLLFNAICFKLDIVGGGKRLSLFFDEVVVALF